MASDAAQASRFAQWRKLEDPIPQSLAADIEGLLSEVRSANPDLVT
ncbi:MAG: hypothetical protein ACRDRK_26400 [Pseudonocardia sp.]